MERIATRKRRQGNVLVAALIAFVILASWSASVIVVVTSGSQEATATRDDLRRDSVTEAGLRRAVLEMTLGGTGNVGSAAAPVAFGGGSYFTTSVDNGDGTFTVRSFGTLGGTASALEAVVRRAGGLFSHSVFAGNSSGDPNYVMDFGGIAGQADSIAGDVYSGGDVSVWGDADLQGTTRARGTITGTLGDSGVHQPLPDLAAMDYENNHDVDVASDFAASATPGTILSGGTALQLPESMPAHIFRKNPDDRSTETSGTTKDDYFLEDPYESITAGTFSGGGSNGYTITLSGDAGNPGPDGNNLIYYIDGNLWLHNLDTLNLKFQHTGVTGLAATFVVKGNIYIGDSLYYSDPQADGLLLIAMKDQAVADSGNIYFGDPKFGTLAHMDGFMYAENDFHDNNLDEQGSADVTLHGMMSAGNQVNIHRDYTANGTTQHSRLVIDYDDRVVSGALNLPGTPGTPSVPEYSIVAWRPVPMP